MKYYTEPLVNEIKKKKRFSSFFLGDSRRTSYYQATNREDGTYLLWIEGINWGKTICYPCVLIQGADTLVFEQGNLDISKKNNNELVSRWLAAVNPEILRRDYDLTELEKQEFHAIFGRYRKMHLDWAIAQAEAENGLNQDTEETNEPEENA